MASSDLSAMLEQLRRQRRAQLDQIMGAQPQRASAMEPLPQAPPSGSTGMGKSLVQGGLKSAFQSPAASLGQGTAGAAAAGLATGGTTLSTLAPGALNAAGIVPGTAATGAGALAGGGMGLGASAGAGVSGAAVASGASSGLGSAVAYILSLL